GPRAGFLLSFGGGGVCAWSGRSYGIAIGFGVQINQVASMIWSQAQLDQCAGIRGDFGLPSIISLVALHGCFSAAVPGSAGFAVKIFLSDQRFLDLRGAGGINLLLPVTFPCSLAGAPAMFGALAVDALSRRL